MKRVMPAEGLAHGERPIADAVIAFSIVTDAIITSRVIRVGYGDGIGILAQWAARSEHSIITFGDETVSGLYSLM